MKLIDILVEGTECNNKITAVFIPECTAADPVQPVRTLGLLFGEVRSGLSVIL